MGISLSRIKFNIPASSKTVTVNNIAARNALTDIQPNDQVFVLDSTGDSRISPGKYALYLYNGGNSFSIIATESSSLADVGSYGISFTPGTDSSANVYTIPSNSLLIKIVVQVQTALNGNPTLTIGNLTTPDAYMSNDDLNLGVIGEYYKIISVPISIPTTINYTFTNDTNSITTPIKISVEFSD